MRKSYYTNGYTNDHESKGKIQMQNTTTAVEVRVPGSSLPLYTDGKRLVALKPIAEYFGLDWAGQFTKLKSKSWATIGKFSTVASDGKTREMTSGDRRTLTMWLATLDENRVRADKRDELIAYQSEAAGALDAFFHNGAAINPRATEHRLQVVRVDQSLRGLAQLHLRAGLEDGDVLAYTEADRDLLESVWQQYYAEPTQLEVEA